MLQRTVGSLLDFEAWLKTRDPNEEYLWDDCRTCACGQYFKERGGELNETWLNGDFTLHNNLLNDLAQRASKRKSIYRSPHYVGTFGKLLKLVQKHIHA